VAVKSLVMKGKEKKSKKKARSTILLRLAEKRAEVSSGRRRREVVKMAIGTRENGTWGRNIHFEIREE